MGNLRPLFPARRWFLPALAILVFLSIGHDRVMAHPYHLCVGQMTWNAQTKAWEVSLRLHPQDLERAMKLWRLAGVTQPLSDPQLVERQKGCSVEDPEFEKVVAEFLQGEFFFLALPEGSTAGVVKAKIESQEKKEWVSSIQWVGKESEKGWLWLHFEVTPPELDADRPELWIVNKILIDVIEKQENSLSVQRSPRDKTALMFKKGEISHRFVAVE